MTPTPLHVKNGWYWIAPNGRTLVCGSDCDAVVTAARLSGWAPTGPDGREIVPDGRENATDKNTGVANEQS